MRLPHGCREGFALVAAARPAYNTLKKAGKTDARSAPQDQAQDQKVIIMNVARSFNNWVKYRQTVLELGRMSNRELNDLGIARADIRSVARAATR